MLKELVESSFFYVFPLRRDTVPCLIEEEHHGVFSLADQLACQSCREPCGPEKAQILLNSSELVHAINLNQVFGILEESVGENCDYLLDNNRVVVFLEMTCSLSEYAQRKRQKSKSQMYNTLNVMFCVNPIRNHIEQATKRYVVFSWKDTSVPNDMEDKVDFNMSGMTVLNDEVYSIDNESKFDFDFIYKEVRFPDCLDLDSL